MSEMIKLTAQDGAEITAYRADPQTAPTGAIILLQEIFGLNAHIKSVCDDYAKMGWQIIAPALFDRQKPDVELAYDSEGIKQGLDFKKGADDTALIDIEAALKSLDKGLPKAVIGYCWGGSLAWRAACQPLDIDVAIAYYGGELPGLKDQQAHLPVMAHFGRKDSSIPIERAEAFIASQPQVECFIYDADHGFNCDHRTSFDKPSAELARQRTIDFIQSVFSAV